MTRVVATCPEDCVEKTPNEHEVHPNQLAELNRDEDRILDWLYNGYTECPYCNTTLSLRIGG